MADFYPIVIDTNILTYAYDNSSIFNKVAKEFLTKESEIKGKICFTTQILLEFLTVITHKVKNPLKPQKAIDIINYLQKKQKRIYIVN